MNKLYLITESQYSALIESKLEQKKVFNKICEEIDAKRKTLTEGKQLSEGIVDTIKSYMRSGMLTVGIITALLVSMKASPTELQQAGVPQQTIEKAVQNAKMTAAPQHTLQLPQQNVVK